MILTIMIILFVSVLTILISLSFYNDFNDLYNNKLTDIKENNYDECYNDLISKMYDNETAKKLCEIQIENRGK